MIKIFVEPLSKVVKAYVSLGEIPAELRTSYASCSMYARLRAMQLIDDARKTHARSRATLLLAIAAGYFLLSLELDDRVERAKRWFRDSYENAKKRSAERDARSGAHAVRWQIL